MLIEVIALETFLGLWNPLGRDGVEPVRDGVVAGPLAGRLPGSYFGKDALIVRIGLRWTVQVPFTTLASVRPVKAQPSSRKTPGYLKTLLLGTPPYLIALNHPIVAHSLYGRRKTITTLGLAVDDIVSFEAARKHRLADGKHHEGSTVRS